MHLYHQSAWQRRVPLILAALLALALLPPALAAPASAPHTNYPAGSPPIYVDQDAGGANNGSSWANAYTSLQAALAVAQPGAEIWVAAGVYRPGSARSASFTLRPGVAIYGGFAGNESLREQRNWTTHITVLSGDLDHNDQSSVAGVVASAAQIIGNNAYHVVTGGGVTATARLDGFTITAGRANGSSTAERGAGMYNLNSSPTLANLVFSGNLAQTDSGLQGMGGGMYNSNSHPILSNVSFSGNQASLYGGGMYNGGSNPTLNNVSFSDNRADAGGPASNGGGAGMYNTASRPRLTNVSFLRNWADWGGGLRNDGNNQTVLTNVRFVDNQADGTGGGMFSQSTNQISLTNVLFSGNRGGLGGGLFNGSNTTATLTNVSFSRNQANGGGGLFNRSNSRTQITNSILWGNQPEQIANDSGGSVTVSFSNVQGGYTGSGNQASDPRFVNPTGHNLSLQPHSPAINTGSQNRASCPTSDLDQQPRNDGRCDMGAYEYAGGNRLLALYVLAFDNRPISPMNLSPYYHDTLQAIITATNGRPELQALVLADLEGAHTTVLHKVQDGSATPLDAVGVLEIGPSGFDSTDPYSLGKFIAWAQSNYPANRTTLSYIGHNAPLPPETDAQFYADLLAAGGSSSASAASLPEGAFVPMPIHIGADPDFTDSTPANLLSTADIALALQIGTDNGARPIDVLDLLHCFGMAIETVAPLAPYVRVVTGSPNYAFFGPPLVAAGLAAITPSMSAAQLGSALVTAYDAALPASDHPRIIVAVDASTLPAVKHRWDALSRQLWLGLRDTATAASYRTKLRQAYRDSHKYDSTFCKPQDWELATPDALVDIELFARQLQRQFGASSAVGLAAADALSALAPVVLQRAAKNGTPWFAAPLKPYWDFSGNIGISLYADLEGTPISGATVLSWHAEWYTATVSIENPQPYAFIASSSSGISWADVFATFWQSGSGGGEPIETAVCMPALPPAQRPGELAAVQVLNPPSGLARVGLPITITVQISAAQVAYNPLVSITVRQDGAVVFSDLVGTGYLTPGNYAVSASKPWIPTQPGTFSVSFMVDSDNRVLETNETNNTADWRDLVQDASSIPPPVIAAQLASGQQWIASSTLQLRISQLPTLPSNPAARVNALQVVVAQYPAGSNPASQVPTPIASQTIIPFNPAGATLSLTLPPTTRPGPVVLQIWPYASNTASLPNPPNGIRGNAAVVQFNYLPANTTLAANGRHYFCFTAGAAQRVTLNQVLSAGSAQLSAWHTAASWAATSTSSGQLVIGSTWPGTYIVELRAGASGATYTLSGTRGDPPVPL